MKFTKQTKQVVILYASTLSGVLLGVVASIINTRFLSPADYGDVRYVQNIINFIASLLLFGYFLSGSRLLAISSGESESRRIRGCMIVILGGALVVLIAGILICTGLQFAQGKDHIAHLFLLSVPVCAYPLFLNYVNTTAMGDNHIKRLAAARLLPNLSYIPIAYLLYSQSGATSSRMILLQWGLASLILCLIILSTRPRFKRLSPIFRTLNKENKSYGLQLYYGSLAMVATNYIAGITLSLFGTDNTTVGFFTLALTITTPLQMLPAIIGTAYFKQFATQPRIPHKVFQNTILLASATCILFILLIKPLVSFLYSEPYSIVSTYASWMAVGFSIHGVGDMINRYLGSHGQGKVIRNSSYFCGAIKISGYILFVYLWGINGALLTNVLSSGVYFITLFIYYTRFIKNGTTYANLFTVILDSQYDDLWLSKAAAIVGEDAAQENVDYLKGFISADIYGEEAVEAYKDAGYFMFDCWYLADVDTFTFDGDTVTTKLTDGSEQTHIYEYLGSYQLGEGEMMTYGGETFDASFPVDVYKTADDAGEFTYFLFRDDTMQTTWHIEFRYGSDLDQLLKYMEGPYAYWLSAGIDADASPETIDSVIDLFVSENLGGEE